VTFRLRMPDGATVVDHAMQIDDDQQRWLGFAGAVRPGNSWPAGIYAGEVALERAPAERITLKRSIELLEP